MGSFLVSGCSVSGTTSLASDLTDLSQESRKSCGGSEAGVVVEKWVTFFRMRCYWPSNLDMGMTTLYTVGLYSMYSRLPMLRAESSIQADRLSPPAVHMLLPRRRRKLGPRTWVQHTR